MILRDLERKLDKKQLTLAPICGYGMDQLILTEKDIRTLREVTNEELRDWLERVHVRFYRVEE